MKIKELLIVNNTKAYLNIVSYEGHRIYEGRGVFITSDLMERKDELVYIMIEMNFSL